MLDSANKLIGLSKVIESSFISVFNAVDVSEDVGKEYQATLREQARKYALWIIKHYSEIPLLGTNKSTLIDNLYVSLRYTSKVRQETKSEQSDFQGENIESIIENAITMKPEGNNKDPGYYDIALMGGAGSGKSTTLKYLALTAARGDELRAKQRIPIYLSLRNTNYSIKPGFIFREILHFFRRFDFKSPEKITVKLLKSGSILLLIDDLDELSEKDRKIAIHEISSIKAKPIHFTDQKNIICVTGKPYALAQELPEFFKYTIQPLDYREKAKFIQRWYNNVNIRKGDELLKYLRHGQGIKNIGESPLSMSMICSLHHHEYAVPSTSDELFEDCVKGLLAKWDYFKDTSKSTLISDYSEDTRLMLVASIAARTLLNNDIEFTAADASVKQACKDNRKYTENKVLDSHQLLKSLCSDYEILKEYSKSTYRFSHTNFQKFLAGYWIAKNRLEIKFIDSINNNLLKWSSVIEYIARNTTISAASFILRLHYKINYTSAHEISLIKRVLCHKDTKISAKEKEKLIYLIANKSQSHLDYFIKDNKKCYYANGILAVEIPLESSLQTVKSNYRCLKLFSNIVESQYGKHRLMDLQGNMIPQEFFFFQRGHDISHRIKHTRANPHNKGSVLNPHKKVYTW